MLVVMGDARRAVNPWETLYQEYVATAAPVGGVEATARRTRVIRQARALLARAYRGAAWWVTDALADPARKSFVASVMDANVPRYFFAAMIRAGVREPDASEKLCFIEPCVGSYGHRRVTEALLVYLESGTEEDRAGATIALYWASIRDAYFWMTGRVIDAKKYVPTPEAQAAYDSWQPVRAKRTALLIKEFNETDDLTVRQYIVAQLFLDPAHDDDLLRALGPIALDIARRHGNRYVKRRAALLSDATW
jgi:hypothetical protein